jgi:hypothetical protein
MQGDIARRIAFPPISIQSIQSIQSISPFLPLRTWDGAGNNRSSPDNGLKAGKGPEFYAQKKHPLPDDCPEGMFCYSRLIPLLGSGGLLCI